MGKQIDCLNDYTYLELANFVNDITERDKRIFNLPSLVLQQGCATLAIPT
jgi:hypothetical protein